MPSSKPRSRQVSFFSPQAQPDLIMGLIRKNSCYRLKAAQNGKVLSSQPFNLTNKHSLSYSGCVRNRVNISEQHKDGKSSIFLEVERQDCDNNGGGYYNRCQLSSNPHKVNKNAHLIYKNIRQIRPDLLNVAIKRMVRLVSIQQNVSGSDASLDAMSN